ncbi:uncharacterized protein LOC120199863 isoform X2 [Hibiscus syriacus]|uniref:uncharacterized protein LOC120199863 isoform X2 n=1 Tax=Hibiscus syriacus TaxID=106335 RepID=UPI001923F1C8|nr:uncharacterized protein LOC120199863 isoform X2 [Hibiscus syriacus]
MNKSRATPLSLFLLWLIIISHQIRPVVCQEKQNEEKPTVFQLLSNTLALLKKSHKSYWEKMKGIVHELQLHFTPPSLEGTGKGKGPAAAVGAGEKVKEAVKDSIGTSEAIAKETAKSAAEAIHRTTEKLKGTAPVSGNEESRDEL